MSKGSKKKLITLQEDSNPSKDAINQGTNTEISIEKENLKVYPQL